MELLLFFLFTCFFAGLLLPKLRLVQLGWMLAGLSVVVMAGYYFLRMI